MNPRQKIENSARKLAKWLHIPIGLALILAIMLTPKIVAVAAILWYAIGVLTARLWQKEKEDE